MGMKYLSVFIVFLGFYLSTEFASLVFNALKVNVEYTSEPYYFQFFSENLGFLISTFVLSFAFNNISFSDIYWSLFPVYTIDQAVYKRFLANQKILLDVRLMFPLLLINFWGIRLASQWARDWKGFPHVDWRYAMFERKCKYAFQWWIQAFVIFFVIPGTFVFYGTTVILEYFVKEKFDLSRSSLSCCQLLGVLALLFSQIYQYSADHELYEFREKQKPGDKNVIDQGVWRYSRHPNYFGEVLFWWSHYLYTYQFSFKYPVGAALISLMFFFGSAPMMEKYLLEGTRSKSYANYRSAVFSSIIPFFRFKN